MTTTAGEMAGSETSIAVAVAIAEIQRNCELLIASHTDREGTGDCEKCDQPYPCYARLTAEDVVDDLAKLARLNSPTATAFGYPPYTKEPT